jgi:hypothetical protein
MIQIGVITFKNIINGERIILELLGTIMVLG